MEELLQIVWELCTVFGVKIIAALAVFIIGRWVAKMVANLIRKVMANRKVDSTLVKFVGSLTNIALLAFVIIAALGLLGIQTTSFIALLGAAGLAIGLALQGSLSNFAAGVMLIIFHPFKVGEFIEGGGVAGTVEEVGIFTTTLLSPDNKTIIVPNSNMTADNIVNYSTRGTRRVDMVFGIGYEDDIDKAKGIITETLARDERVLKDPVTKIAVSELADSSVNIIARPWVNSADYWNLFFEVTESIKKSFDAEGISIPYPQRDIHVYEHKE